MNKPQITPVPVAIVSTLLALAMAGCTVTESSAVGPDEAPAPVSEAPTEPSTPPVALTSKCTELLDPASVDELETTNYSVSSEEETTAYVDKIRAEGSYKALFVDQGGLLCPITNGTRVSELFGFAPISAEVAEVQKARLLAESYTTSDHLGGVLYSDSKGYEDVIFEYLFVGDYWFGARTVERLDEVVANSGIPLP